MRVYYCYYFPIHTFHDLFIPFCPRCNCVALLALTWESKPTLPATPAERKWPFNNIVLFKGPQSFFQKQLFPPTCVINQHLKYGGQKQPTKKKTKWQTKFAIF